MFLGLGIPESELSPENRKDLAPPAQGRGEAGELLRLGPVGEAAS